MNNTVNLTLIGYGEVGRIFARDFLARGDTRVTAYDLNSMARMALPCAKKRALQA